eukprot:6093726-Ditylum_brightwellii.AAC.1
MLFSRRNGKVSCNGREQHPARNSHAEMKVIGSFPSLQKYELDWQFPFPPKDPIDMGFNHAVGFNCAAPCVPMCHLPLRKIFHTQPLHKTVSMEGVSMKYHKKEEDNLVPVSDQEQKLISEFYSYLSDDSDQNAATTTTHLDNVLVKLVGNKIVSQKLNILIDCAVGAPDHGEDVVDGLNAVDKAYLNKMMFI